MTLLCVCEVDSFIPELEHLIQTLFHGPFSKKKPLKSDSWIRIHEMKLRSTSSAEKNFVDEITWISWKTKQDLEIWPFLNSLLEKRPHLHNQIYSRISYAISMLKLTKFPPPYGGGVHFLPHKTFLEQVHSARSSCTADAQPLNGFENGPNLANNRIDYVLLISWDGNSIFFSANRARPSSQKLPLNGFTKWNFRRSKERAFRIGNKFDCVEAVSLGKLIWLPAWKQQRVSILIFY